MSLLIVAEKQILNFAEDTDGATMIEYAFIISLGEISSGFTQDQLGALDTALDFNNPTPHPVNLRVTLFGLFYLVVLAGPPSWS